MDNKQEKRDPIKDKFYGPLERAEIFGNLLFYSSALLSFAIVLLNKTVCPLAYNIIQSLFVVVVIFYCLVSMVIRLHLMPRAQENRLKDFFSHAYSIPLTDEQTDGYFNNNETTPIRRIAAQTLENSFYSKDTILQMAKIERIKVIVYGTLWLIAILNRNTDLALVSIGAQIIFSEQLVSRWLHVEWLRTRFESTYNELFKLFKSVSKKRNFEVLALEITTRYEITKSCGRITLSKRIFERRSERNDKKWEKVRNLLF